MSNVDVQRTNNENESEILNPADYNKFVRGVDIKAINLKGLVVSDVDSNVGPDLDVNLRFSCDEYKLDGDTMEAYPVFVLDVSKSINDETHYAFKINAQFVLIYTIENLEDYGQEYFKMFLDRNVPFNVWPYGRELISSLTTKLGLPALFIDPLKS